MFNVPYVDICNGVRLKENGMFEVDRFRDASVIYNVLLSGERLFDSGE